MAESSVADSFTRKVMLLKCSDFFKKDDKMVMLTLVELGVLRRSPTGRYQKNVPFSSKMSDEEVRETLRQSYPLFNLTRRFSCASFSQKSSTFIFHGDPRVWDGAMIKKTVKGDSVLYIILEDDQMPQESAHETNDATISSAQVALSTLNQTTSMSDTSATVMVQNTLQPQNDYSTQEGNILNGPLAASTNSNLINPLHIADAAALQNMDQLTRRESSATFMDQSNMYPLDDSLMLDYTAPWDIMMPQESAPETNDATISSAPVALSTLNQTTSMSDTSATVMVQNTLQPQNDYSTQEGNILNGPLAASTNSNLINPLHIADAAALQNMDQLTRRESSATFMDQSNMYPLNDSITSEYITCMDRVLSTSGFTESQNAAPAAGGGLNLETALDQSMEMSDSSADNHNTTSGISGLDHNLSSDDLSPHEDEHFDFSVTPKKVPLQGAEFCFSSDRALPGNVQSAFAVFEFNLGTVEVRRFGEDSLIGERIPQMNYLADELREIELAREDQEFGIKKAAGSHSLMCFCETRHFNREQVNSTVANKVVLLTSEGWQLSLFQDSFIREPSGLKHLRSLNRCDTSFFLGSEQESIHCHLITEYERWCLLFEYMKDSNLRSRTFAAEGGQFVAQVNQETQAVMIGASFSCVEDLTLLQSTRELVTTSYNPELAVEWGTTQGSTTHSTSSDLWVLTCLYHPARNILFVYVADNSDVLPRKAHFDDCRYELSTQHWQWQRCCSSLFDVQNKLQEMRNAEQMSPEIGPTPLPTYSAKMLPQVQGKHGLGQPKCCPTWLYIMMHQCWVYAPVERLPVIAIFDGISSRTPGAHLMVTWLNHYNQGKYLPLNKRRSEDPCLVNDKANHPSSNVNVTYYGSARKEKLYEEQLHEDDGSNVVCIDKHLLLEERIKREYELPSVTAHSPSKTFHKVSKGSRDTQKYIFSVRNFLDIVPDDLNCGGLVVKAGAQIQLRKKFIRGLVPNT